MRPLLTSLVLLLSLNAQAAKPTKIHLQGKTVTVKGILLFDSARDSALVVNPLSRSAHHIRISNWERVKDGVKKLPVSAWVEAKVKITRSKDGYHSEGELLDFSPTEGRQAPQYDSELKPIAQE